jgi:hypothetical protein
MEMFCNHYKCRLWRSMEALKSHYNCHVYRCRHKYYKFWAWSHLRSHHIAQLCEHLESSDKQPVTDATLHQSVVEVAILLLHHSGIGVYTAITPCRYGGVCLAAVTVSWKRLQRDRTNHLRWRVKSLYISQVLNPQITIIPIRRFGNYNILQVRGRLYSHCTSQIWRVFQAIFQSIREASILS